MGHGAMQAVSSIRMMRHGTMQAVGDKKQYIAVGCDKFWHGIGWQDCLCQSSAVLVLCYSTCAGYTLSILVHSKNGFGAVVPQAQSLLRILLVVQDMKHCALTESLSHFSTEVSLRFHETHEICSGGDCMHNVSNAAGVLAYLLADGGHGCTDALHAHSLRSFPLCEQLLNLLRAQRGQRHLECTHTRCV